MYLIYNSRNLIVFIDKARNEQGYYIYNSRNLIVFIDEQTHTERLRLSTIVEI